MMWKITFILAVISATSRGQSGSGGDVLLSCDHPLKVLHPEQFTHCSSCFYGTWSEWSRSLGLAIQYHPVGVTVAMLMK